MEIAKRKPLVRTNEVAAEATGGPTVTVASKLPMPLILQLHDKVMRMVPVLGGGSREEVFFQKRNGARTFVVQGCSFAQNKGPSQQLASGFGLTHSIPKAFWDEWLEQNDQSDMVRNGMIFAHTEMKSTTDQALDMENEKSGMERLDPQNLPKGLETATQRAA